MLNKYELISRSSELALFIYLSAVRVYFSIDRDLQLQQLHRRSKLNVQQKSPILASETILVLADRMISTFTIIAAIQCYAVLSGPWLSNIKAFSFRHPFTSSHENICKYNTRFLPNEMQLLKKIRYILLDTN